MEVPIWLIALATIWKLGIETAKLVTDYKVKMKQLELEAKKPQQ